MTLLTTNLRKAAILLRSVDAETAACLLAKLSPAEAKSIRLAIQSLGPIDADERADVASEIRRVGPLVAEDPRRGVELDISSTATSDVATPLSGPSAGKPFEFLEQARVESLVPYLAREHGQTVAVVLSYLAPRRAAEVLAALPARLQAETIERLSKLGETDPASLQVLERELAEWVARRQATRSRGAGRSDAVAAILAAADDTARHGILANLMKVNRHLAEQIAPWLGKLPESKVPAAAKSSPPSVAYDSAAMFVNQPANNVGNSEPRETALSKPRPDIPTKHRLMARPREPQPRLAFDDLARLDESTLAKVLKAVDADVWVLALAAANNAVVERIAGQMPRSAAKAFRRRLRQLGPTRLSDVEAAQQEVVAVASRVVQRPTPDSSHSMKLSR